MAQLEHARDAGSAGEDWFQTTHWSVVLAAGASGSARAQAALERLCQTYWYPLYAYVRRRGHSPHDAQDLTQEFFARLLSDDSLAQVHADKGKFRSFLLAAMNHFLANVRDRAQAQKRGGGCPVISLDDDAAEDRYQLEPSSSETAEVIFERRWVLTLLAAAMRRLQAGHATSQKAALFERLKGFLEGEVKPGDYAAAGADLRMTPNAVGVAVHRLRQQYRELVRDEVAQTVATPAEVEEEMKHLLAVLSR